MGSATIDRPQFVGGLVAHTDRSMIRASHDACRASGLSRADHLPEHIVSDRVLHENKRLAASLLDVGLPLMEQLKSALRQTGSSVFLASADGMMLASAGFLDEHEGSAGVHLRPGSDWSEQAKGTNGIGTAARTRIPVRIHADEHFLFELGGLSCSAAPVFSPMGEMLGVIDITSRSERPMADALLVVSLLAEMMQNRLMLQSPPGFSLLELSLAGGVERALVSLDRENRVVEANQAALRLLGENCLGKEYRPVATHGQTGAGIAGLVGNGARGTTNEAILVDRRPGRFSVQAWNPSADTSAGAQTSHAFPTPGAGETPDSAFARISGTCAQMTEVRELARKAATTDLPILLLGESGTGKGLFATAIHGASHRATSAFVPIHCSTVNGEAFAAELHGIADAPGRLDESRGGTLYLDEIGDLDEASQIAVLRLLDREHAPFASRDDGAPSFRIIASTNKDLERDVADGRFRSDLFYRLNVITISLPPLRQRSDLEELARCVLRDLGSADVSITQGGMDILRAHAWPGNVRELRHVLTQAALLSRGESIDASHIRLSARPERGHSADGAQRSRTWRSVEAAALQEAIDRTGGNIKKAATTLGIGRNTLYRKMRAYGLARP